MRESGLYQLIHLQGSGAPRVENPDWSTRAITRAALSFRFLWAIIGLVSHLNPHSGAAEVWCDAHGDTFSPILTFPSRWIEERLLPLSVMRTATLKQAITAQ